MKIESPMLYPKTTTTDTEWASRSGHAWGCGSALNALFHIPAMVPIQLVLSSEPNEEAVPVCLDRTPGHLKNKFMIKILPNDGWIGLADHPCYAIEDAAMPILGTYWLSCNYWEYDK